ncbi:hypothetical protein D3C78_1631560 [compost metagenome]
MEQQREVVEGILDGPRMVEKAQVQFEVLRQVGEGGLEQRFLARVAAVQRWFGGVSRSGNSLDVGVGVTELQKFRSSGL